MRQHHLTAHDVALVLASDDAVIGADNDGNMLYTAKLESGLIIRVVVAADAPDMVISVFPRRHL